jgi:hypothetical protein
VLNFVPNNRRIPSRLSSCRSPLQHSPTLGLMGPIIWPSKAHRGATRPANLSKARRRQPRSFSLLGGGSVPDARASPQSWCSMQYREAGFWAEHSRFFRNADTQNAQCASGAGCRSSQNGHKTRADEPVVLGARDKSALVRENCLPVIASAGTKADTFLSLPLPIQPSKLKAVPLSDYAVPHAPVRTK